MDWLDAMLSLPVPDKTFLKTLALPEVYLIAKTREQMWKMAEKEMCPRSMLNAVWPQVHIVRETYEEMLYGDQTTIPPAKLAIPEEEEEPPKKQTTRKRTTRKRKKT
jgi:hypothetical protein